MTAHLVRVRSRLALHAHRKVRGLLEGQYAAAQAGRGTELDDLRDYVRGDDVGDLDWKASARTGSLLVRRYQAERRHTVLLVVSTGREMAALNDVGVPKRRLAALVAGVLGQLALGHGDRVGLVHGHAGGAAQLPPRTGDVHLERCLAAAHDATRDDGPPGDLVGLLAHVARTVRRRSIAVVVTDDVPLGPDGDLPAALAAVLRRLAAQHELLLVTVADLDPTRAPAAPLVDVASGARLPAWLVDDPRLAEEYAAASAADAAGLQRALDRLGVPHERVHDEESAVAAVLRLLERQRRGRR